MRPVEEEMKSYSGTLNSLRVIKSTAFIVIDTPDGKQEGFYVNHAVVGEDSWRSMFATKPRMPIMIHGKGKDYGHHGVFIVAFRIDKV
jgi:hypothetical protein